MKKFPVIAPLFWLKGEDLSVLADGLARLRSAGINECILEARPFDGWLQDPWFDTLEGLFAEAERTGMRLWLFDDLHFPSGNAGGLMPLHLRKQMIRRFHADIATYGGRVSLHIPQQDDDVLFKAVCAPYSAATGFDDSKAEDVTDKVKDNKLILDLPAGRFRVFYIFITHEGGEEYTRDWANMIDPAAVDTFINIVYETHYQKLEKYFRNGVMAGFFSDEPRMGSAPNYTSLPGDGTTVSFPYSDLLAERLGDQPAGFWPALWYDCPNAARHRVVFMDTVSKLYSENFPQKVGRWCREHSVQYIGHLIEDNGAHSRLGYGTGHFFRGLAGQDFSMIDSVLHQNLPGMEDGNHGMHFGACGHNSHFFHWGLGKLGASAAHLYPEFNGQAVIESFGAFGWRFGLDAMKRMTDHFAVRGINAFVPHAFSNAPFPDEDCPPHFYARGANPQWKFFGRWTQYCRNVCRLLTGGKHISGAAVLYHAEAEWSSLPFTPFEEVGAKLQKKHFDYDIVPLDLLRTVEISDGMMVVNGEVFTVLIVPEGYLLPEYEEVIKNLEMQGLEVIRGNDTERAEARLFSPVKPGAPEKLRTYTYSFDDDNTMNVFFVNESVDEDVEFECSIDFTFFYDPDSEKEYAPQKKLRLAPGESIFGIRRYQHKPRTDLPLFPSALNVVREWRLETAKEITCDFSLPVTSAGRGLYLEFLQNEGVLEVTCNGKEFPALFSPPYRIDITDIAEKENHLLIRVTSTPDAASVFEYDIPRNMSIFCKVLESI